jgi:transcriptional/translational regulatory protein YebC/TACO1
MVEYEAHKTGNDEMTVEIGDGATHYRFMFISEENIVVLPKKKYSDVKLVETLKEKEDVREVYSNNKATYQKE